MLSTKKLRQAAAGLLVSALLLALPITASAASAASAAGRVTTSAGNLNVRGSAGTSGAVVGKLPSGSYVSLISKTGSWWRVEYAAGYYGYVSADYISGVSGADARQTSTSLNVRSGPGASYNILSVLSSGETVLVLSQSGSWCRILYDGVKTGYVNASYLNALMTWPVPASRQLNQYYSASHGGIDIAASARDSSGVSVAGDKVVAATGGTVVYSGWLDGYGYVVYINSTCGGQPIQTRYGHLASAPLVKAGQTAGAGQLIGYMGNTGTASGVHLHFEVRYRYTYDDCLANTASNPADPLWFVG